MTMWLAILAAAGLAWLTKFAGHLAPDRWLRRPGAQRAANAITVSLLAALLTIQAIGAGAGIRLDARVPAVLVAAVALWRRAPFLLVVLLAAGCAVLLRLAGWD